MFAAPIISVIIVNYNGFRFINAAIKGVIAQTFEEREMIVNDNCSTDYSWEITQSWQALDARIRATRSDTQASIPIARNRSIVEARGEYVATIDSDDIWL